MDPAVVAWFVRASLFSFSRSEHSANGGSNPAWDDCVNGNTIPPTFFKNGGCEG